jgi:hypothetical protein
MYDNSIESYHYFDYTPQSQQNLDTRGSPIVIDIHSNDAYILPCKSYLIIKGNLVKSDNNVYDANDQITMVNNAMMYLFSNIRFAIGGNDMEMISNPGQTTSMIGYLSQPDDYSTSAGLKSCWCKDTTNDADSAEFTRSQGAPVAGYTPTKSPTYNQGFAARRALLMSANPRGSFSFVIPFEHMFGFSEYDKVIYGVKHTLSLTRNISDNLCIHIAQGVPDGKIKLTNITWRVPQVQLETSKLIELRNIIVEKRAIPVSFRARNSESIIVPLGSRQFEWRLSVTNGIEKPRWIIVGFQTNKDNSQEQNPAVFDHVNLCKAYVTLNSQRYPLNETITDFKSNDYSVLYEMFDNFKKEYYGFNSLVGGTQVNYSSFKTLFPIIVFDVRHQSERLKSGVMDMMLRFTFEEGIPQNTCAYATIISDREYKFTSDGKNLTMITS